jgi:phosphatidylglycerol:prolipoprotein diacylglycerol transferase
MVPYVELTEIPLGEGVRLSVFGTLVVLGVLSGARVAERRARAAGIGEPVIHAAILWTVLPGFVVAHAAAILPRDGTLTPRLAFEFWNGMSSFGGFSGAALGLAMYATRLPRGLWLPVADILVQALVVGWVFGRLGCFLVHDHIGRSSTSWLAVAFPDGSRHDLGLYELVFTLGVLVPAVVALNRAARPPGATIAVVALLYAPARFFADFLRHTDLPGADARYAGLTLSQYGCLVLAAIGIAFGWRILRPAARSS